MQTPSHTIQDLINYVHAQPADRDVDMIDSSSAGSGCGCVLVHFVADTIKPDNHFNVGWVGWNTLDNTASGVLFDGDATKNFMQTLISVCVKAKTYARLQSYLTANGYHATTPAAA